MFNRLALLFIILPIGTAAQTVVSEWGCLYVESFDPGERDVMWCDIASLEDSIPCFKIDRDAFAPAEKSEPIERIEAGIITERKKPNDGGCPLLPGDRSSDGPIPGVRD